MADKNILGQMLEHLVNNEKDKAEELFHEYVVARSRDIYEGLIENEIAEEEDKEEDEEVDEAAEKDEDESDEDLDENFEEVAYEGDDEEDGDMMGGDPTDDLEGELDAEMGDDEEGGEKSEEELFMDLESIVDELQAKFDELKGDDMGDMGDDEEMKDEFDLATVREYVEKVPAGHGAEKKGAAEKADNTKSTIDNMKNDMGGTTANILSSKEDAATYANQGQLKGSGLLKGTPKEDNAGNINTPGAKNGNAFSKKEPGHGAEKAGAKESADNKQSLFRGRR
jgi:hypothetical protein